MSGWKQLWGERNRLHKSGDGEQEDVSKYPYKHRSKKKKTQSCRDSSVN